MSVAAGSVSTRVVLITRTDNTWTEQQKLTASDGEAGQLFGFQMALSGDTLIIGS